MSSPSNNEVAPPPPPVSEDVSPNTPPVPTSPKRPLLRQSSVIDLTMAGVEVEQAVKRARDVSFKPASESTTRSMIRQVLTEIAGKHISLATLVKDLCPEKEGEFIREVEGMFSLSFSETFCAIAINKSK